MFSESGLFSYIENEKKGDFFSTLSKDETPILSEEIKSIYNEQEKYTVNKILAGILLFISKSFSIDNLYKAVEELNKISNNKLQEIKEYDILKELSNSGLLNSAEEKIKDFPYIDPSVNINVEIKAEPESEINLEPKKLAPFFNFEDDNNLKILPMEKLLSFQEHWIHSDMGNLPIRHSLEETCERCKPTSEKKIVFVFYIIDKINNTLNFLELRDGYRKAFIRALSRNSVTKEKEILEFIKHNSFQFIKYKRKIECISYPDETLNDIDLTEYVSLKENMEMLYTKDITFPKNEPIDNPIEIIDNPIELIEPEPIYILEPIKPKRKSKTPNTLVEVFQVFKKKYEEIDLQILDYTKWVSFGLPSRQSLGDNFRIGTKEIFKELGIKKVKVEK